MELYALALDLCRKARDSTLEPLIHLNRAEALVGQGNLVEGRQDCSQALRGFRRLDDALRVADVLRLYGHLCRLERSWEEGESCLQKSIELSRRFGEPVTLAEAFREMGLLRRDQGRAIEAVEPLRDAERIFDQAGASLDLEQVRTALEELEPA